MNDFTIRSDAVDVEQIMRQIRTRIREKRGVDYTEEEIRDLATVRLEKFLDPKGVRSDLLDQFRQHRPPANFGFEESTIYVSSRGWLGRVLTYIRKLLNPFLRLLFNPNPIIHALHKQSTINERREVFDALSYEVLHNLVVELTRLGIDVKNVKMRVESLSSRLDFDERRARALEGVVQYRPGLATPKSGAAADQAQTIGGQPEAAGTARRSRRRRRRGRRRGGSPAQPTAPSATSGPSAVETVEPAPPPSPVDEGDLPEQ